MFILFLYLFSLPVGLFANLPQQNPAEFNASALQTLALEEYVTWTPSGTTPMVFSVTSSEHMEVMLADTSGRLWLVQSEPERVVEDSGTDTEPPAVAAALKDVIQPFACCGVVVDDAGLTWLDGYLAANGPVPDVWHIHIFQQWSGGWIDASARFERWMVNNDVQRPVIVSEAAAGHAPVYLQVEVMQTAYQQLQSVPWLCAVYWFSAHHSSVMPLWPNADLLTVDGERTALGHHFVRLRSAQTEFSCSQSQDTGAPSDGQEPESPPQNSSQPPDHEPATPPQNTPEPPDQEPESPPQSPPEPPDQEPKEQSPTSPPAQPSEPEDSQPQIPPPVQNQAGEQLPNLLFLPTIRTDS